MSLLITFFLTAIIASFLCSIWESVLLSMTPSYIYQINQKNPKVGALMTKFKEDIDRPLAAILTLNTIAHTAGAMGVGVQAGKIYGSASTKFLGFDVSYESLIAGIMTLCILFLSEIIPKTLGANYWKELGVFTTRCVNFIIYLLYPFVAVSQWITKSLKNNKEESVLTRTDFEVYANLAEESGQIKKSEYTIITNLLDMDELTAKDIMTPRSVAQMVEDKTTLRTYYDRKKPLIFSRIPIYHKNENEITGVLLRTALLEHLLEGEDNKTVSEIQQPALFVDEDISLQRLSDTLLKQQEHMAIVMDEFGNMIGIVTLEDITETILGREILDESDKVADLHAYARKNWEERAKKIGLIE